MTLRFNEFTHTSLISGLERYGPRLDDAATEALYVRLWTGYGLKYTKQDLHALLSVFCHENRFHPVRYYLDGLKWDGKPRIGAWLHKYLGAANTELNAFIGRAFLIAAVRRIRQPGSKFDYLMILEGRQGDLKSMACRKLCADEAWFTNGFKLSNSSPAGDTRAFRPHARG